MNPKQRGNHHPHFTDARGIQARRGRISTMDGGSVDRGTSPPQSGPARPLSSAPAQLAGHGCAARSNRGRHAGWVAVLLVGSLCIMQQAGRRLSAPGGSGACHRSGGRPRRPARRRSCGPSGWRCSAPRRRGPSPQARRARRTAAGRAPAQGCGCGEPADVEGNCFRRAIAPDLLLHQRYEGGRVWTCGDVLLRRMLRMCATAAAALEWCCSDDGRRETKRREKNRSKEYNQVH